MPRGYNDGAWTRVRPHAAALLVLAVVCVNSGCALLVAGAAGGGAAGAATAVGESRRSDHPPMTYVGTVVGNVVYVPAKVVVAALGALTSGAAYVVTLGRTNVSNAIWRGAVGGTYVLTPAMIEGEERIRFVGS